MFTGIIEAIGSIRTLKSVGSDYRVFVDSGALDLGDVKLGDSIAVNGVCLTVIRLEADGFWADVSGETVRKTRLAKMGEGSKVNLEKALTPTTRLGGHLVSGHVDGVGKVIERNDDGRSLQFTIDAPKSIARYIAAKGSITIDGISLTVNSVNESLFELNIVPHTLDETTLKTLSVGDEVNLEVDLIARYLERLLTGEHKREKPEITSAFLAEHGFMR